jgi:hypothetical protein
MGVRFQFSTGNQIINRYAADGRKLETEDYKSEEYKNWDCKSNDKQSHLYVLNKVVYPAGRGEL